MNHLLKEVTILTKPRHYSLWVFIVLKRIAVPQTLVEHYKQVLPICSICSDKNLKHITHMPIKVGTKRKIQEQHNSISLTTVIIVFMLVVQVYKSTYIHVSGPRKSCKKNNNKWNKKSLPTLPLWPNGQILVPSPPPSLNSWTQHMHYYNIFLLLFV